MDSYGNAEISFMCTSGDEIDGSLKSGASKSQSKKVLVDFIAPYKIVPHELIKSPKQQEITKF